MQYPLVSVLMVSYNSGKFIREAIESVLNQGYSNFELIICDDNSSDETWRIISGYEDPRIKQIRNNKNLGEYKNRNKTISLATGEYLIFIDADDIIYSHGLDFMIRYAVKFSECAMIISRPWDERIILPKKISPRQYYQFEFLDTGICGNNFTKVLFKTAAIKATSLFPFSIKLGDVYMQFLLALTNHSLIIPDASTWWRRNSGQASERLLNDRNFYLMHELWIKLDMLKHPRCPLAPEELATAYKNVYGSYLRTLARSLLQLKFQLVIDLYIKYPVPLRFMSTLLIKEERNYFGKFNGSHPFKDDMHSNG